LKPVRPSWVHWTTHVVLYRRLYRTTWITVYEVAPSSDANKILYTTTLTRLINSGALIKAPADCIIYTVNIHQTRRKINSNDLQEYSPGGPAARRTQDSPKQDSPLEGPCQVPVYQPYIRSTQCRVYTMYTYCIVCIPAYLSAYCM